MANKSVIGTVPKGLSGELTRFLNGLREHAQVQGGKGRGNRLDRAITYRDIQKITGKSTIESLANISASAPSANVKLYGDKVPTAPTGVEALPTFTSVLLKWDRVPNAWYASTEVFRCTALLNSDDPAEPFPYIEENGMSRSPFFSDAVQISTVIAPYYADDLAPGTTVVYWLRHLNRDGQAGPLNNATGIWCTTKRTPLEVLEEYSAEIYQSEAYAWLRSEIGDVDAVNRAMVGAAFDSSMAKLLASGASIDDIMAEQSMLSALDKHTQTSEIKAQFSKNYARLSSGIHAAVSADEAYVQRITTLESRWANELAGKINASIDTFESALTSPTGAITLKVKELSTSFGETTADLSDRLIATSTATGALAERSEKLEAVIDVEGESVSSLLDKLETTIVGEDGAISRALSTYEVTYKSSAVSLETLSESVANNEGNHARWGVKSDVNGKRGGVVFDNDGYMTNFIVDADVFAITNGATDLIPFVVKEGKVVMETALIDTADIFNLIADNITAKKIAATTSITSPTIEGGTITGTSFEVVGTAGTSATIDSNGFLKAEGAEFKSIVIRDANNDVLLSSNGLADTYIATLFGVNATFKGTVYANNLDGDVVDLKLIRIAGASNIPKSSTTLLATFTVASAPWDRVIEIGSFKGSEVNAQSGDLQVLANDVVRATTWHSGPRVGQTSVSVPIIGSAPMVLSLGSNKTTTYEIAFKTSNRSWGGVIATQDIIVRVFKQGSSITQG